MKWIRFLFVLFILLQYSAELYSQEISFYYDKIVDSLSLQSEGDQLLENLTRQIWNESSSNWVNDSLYEHSYNGNNLVDTIIVHKWRYGTTWGNDLRTTYGYNTYDKLILKSFAEILYGNWYDYGRINYSYFGQILSQASYYSFLSGAWYLDGHIDYSYNTNNYLTSWIAYFIDPIFPNFYPPTWKDEFYYDSTNSLIRRIGYDYVGYSHWVYEENDLYSYDNNKNNVEKIRQEWNNIDSVWINDYRYLYEYDINNVLSSIVYQDWQTDSLDWENVWRETYTYTPQNNIATMFKETWAPETGWSNYALRTYFYDLNYNWTKKLTQIWDGSNWKNSYRHLATWIEPVNVWETQTYLDAYYLSNNYPNPFNPSTKIKYQIPVSGFVTLKVYDILGNEIATLISEEKTLGNYEIEFNGNELTSGIYFYQLQAGSFVETKKMILLK